MLTPAGVEQFKGINAALMERILERSTLLPCLNGSVYFSGRLEANQASDPDDIGFETMAIAQNDRRGFGIEIPEGQVWFPSYVELNCRFNTSANYACNLSPLRMELMYTRLRRNVISEFQWTRDISNQYAAFSVQDIAAEYRRVGDDPHNLTGVFKPMLYQAMWPSGATIWFDITATDPAGIAGGIDRMFFELDTQIVYTGAKWLEQLRDTRASDLELLRRLISEGATGFSDVSIR